MNAEFDNEDNGMEGENDVEEALLDEVDDELDGDAAIDPIDPLAPVADDEEEGTEEEGPAALFEDDDEEEVDYDSFDDEDHL